MGTPFGLQPMQQRSRLHWGKFILQPRWLKPPHRPSQAQQSHREKPGPLFTAGKAKGLLLGDNSAYMDTCTESSFSLPSPVPAVVLSLPLLIHLFPQCSGHLSIPTLLSDPAGPGLQTLQGRGSPLLTREPWERFTFRVCPLWSRALLDYCPAPVFRL